jgi:hypothetical protein
VAISAQDVLSPKGKIIPQVIWPGLGPEAVDTKIRAFIQDADEQGAEDAADPDASRKIWVYYRAKAEQVERLLGTPSTATDSDEGSRSYTDAQIQSLIAERDALLEEFDDSIVEEEDEDEYGTIQSYR